MLNYIFLALITLNTAFTLSSCNKSDSAEQMRKTAKTSSLKIIKPAPEFVGTNAANAPFKSASMRGSVWVAYFFFTSCSGPCPMMNQRVEELQKEIPSPNLAFVGISVDPETDTPATMAIYGKRYNADPKRWAMVQMSIDSVKFVAVQGFMLGSPEDPAMHSTRFALVDKRGQIRGFYDGMDEAEVKKLKAAITELLEESL
jgi:protein SCO1